MTLKPKHIITAIVLAFIVISYILLNPGLPLPHLLSDAFFFAGFPFLLISLYHLLTRASFFSGISYSFFRRKTENKDVGYADYVNAKAKPKPDWFFFIVAGGCLLVSFAFVCFI